MIRRVWDWYRERRWWWKLLIGAPAVLLSLTGIYVLVRGVQYARARGEAAQYLPASADLLCGVEDLEGEWERIRKTEFWKRLEGKALKDRAFRAVLNEKMKGIGLPTLDQLDDDRWLEKNWIFRRSWVMRLAGRDAVAALRVGADFKRARMLVATKMGFGPYLLTPFTGLAAGLLGVERVEVGGNRALVVRDGKKTYYIVVDDSHVVVSDDRSLLAEGMRRRGGRPRISRPFWLEAKFERSPALAKWRKEFRAFPSGMALAFLRAERARAMKVEAGVEGTSLRVDMALAGATVSEGTANPELGYLAPGSASAYSIQSAGMREIYRWLQGLASPDPRAKGFDNYVQKQAGEVIVELDKAGFQRRFVDRVEAPAAFLLGSELGSEQRTYTTFALVFRSPNPPAAIEGLRDVFQQLMQKYGRFSTERRGSATLLYFDRATPVKGQNDYLRPCMAALSDGVVLVANNLVFLQRIVDVGVGGGERLIDQSGFRGAWSRMKKAGFAPPGSGGDAGGGFFDLARIRQGLHGHLPEIARKTVERESSEEKLRKRIEADLRRKGARKTVEEVDEMVGREFERRVEEQRGKSERSLTPLEYVRFVAYGVRPRAGGVEFRLMVELR